MSLYKDKGGDGIHINNGIDGGGEYIFHKEGSFRAPASVYAGAARMASDGNIYGSMWGNQWLATYLRNTFQPKGSFTPAGQAYTKAESDGRYVGSGQTWQDMTASRVSGATYTNSTGRLIVVSARQYLPDKHSITGYVNGKKIQEFYVVNGGITAAVTLMVPEGATYMISNIGSIWELQ
ncbi:MAG: hypothetical protein ACMZI0_10265 [Symbiopectobacterium sp.]|uniref:hypothetical protein n=1 Tax=Symbiopectobacterium sp. TaxID=2952789 RepID=UPI0039EA9940